MNLIIHKSNFWLTSSIKQNKSEFEKPFLENRVKKLKKIRFKVKKTLDLRSCGLQQWQPSTLMLQVEPRPHVTASCRKTAMETVTNKPKKNRLHQGTKKEKKKKKEVDGFRLSKAAA